MFQSLTTSADAQMGAPPKANITIAARRISLVEMRNTLHLLNNAVTSGQERRITTRVDEVVGGAWWCRDDSVEFFGIRCPGSGSRIATSSSSTGSRRVSGFVGRHCIGRACDGRNP